MKKSHETHALRKTPDVSPMSSEVGIIYIWRKWKTARTLFSNIKIIKGELKERKNADVLSTYDESALLGV